MTNINKRIENLERSIPQPDPDQVSDAELAQSLDDMFGELQTLGYLTRDWERTEDCPATGWFASAACLAEVIKKGK